MLRISNGRVVDPTTGTDANLDVLLDGEQIARVGPTAEIDNALRNGSGNGKCEVFDAAGLIVAPGFIDLHCHLREPGGEASETIESGTKAAARGGFTAVCAMPNTRPVNDNASVTRSIVERAADRGSVRVWPIGACSLGSKGESLAEIAAMQKAGVVAVSDDGRPVANAKLMRQVMDYCGSLDLPVIDHCEDPSLAAGAVMREGINSTRLGLRGMPAAAESICVGRDVQIAELTRAHLHIAHLSAKQSLELVQSANKRGLHVSCEVTPHHFTLTDEVVAYDTHFKMNPPLASRADREALLAGIVDGSVDAIATDHAPHEPASKAVEFDKAPFGITGFETALALALEQLYHTGRVKLSRLVELFTSGPARVLGKKHSLAAGNPADVTIFSLEQPWTFRAAESASRSRNTPFDGREFRGAPVATVVAGRVVYHRPS